MLLFNGHNEFERKSQRGRLVSSGQPVSVLLRATMLRQSLLPGISQQQIIFLFHLRDLVRWFHGHLWMQRCAVSGLLSCRACFSLRSNPPFCFALCKICAEIVVYRVLAVFLNGLNGKNSSRRIVRNIFSVYFFYSGFKISYSEYFLSHRLLSR